MKLTTSRKIAILTCISVFTFLQYGNSQTTDPVKKANETNKETIADKEKRETAEFLVKAADARMMGIKEGKLAQQLGTSEDIRNYGKLMVKDQSDMLVKIKNLANSRNIKLPADISSDKQDGFKDLSEKKGEDFDKKFCKMMAIDHKRDIRQFKSATELKDQGVSSFANKELPLMETHLSKLEEIAK